MMMLLRYVILAYLLVMGLCYDSTLDAIDWKRMVADEEYMMKYVDCFLDKKPCTEPQAAEYRALLEEIVRETCAKCTDYQKSYLAKIVRRAYEIDPHKAVQMHDKYDPESKYVQAFAVFWSEN